MKIETKSNSVNINDDFLSTLKKFNIHPQKIATMFMSFKILLTLKNFGELNGQGISNKIVSDLKNRGIDTSITNVTLYGSIDDLERLKLISRSKKDKRYLIITEKGSDFTKKTHNYIINFFNEYLGYNNPNDEEFKKENPTKDKIKGGKADKLTPSQFPKTALKKGIAVEMEHTNDPEIAQEIAMDHLVESVDYYDDLEKMEKKMKKNPASKKETSKELIQAIEKLSMDHNYPDEMKSFIKSYEKILRAEVSNENWDKDEALREKLDVIYNGLIKSLFTKGKLARSVKLNPNKVHSLGRYVVLFDSGVEIYVDTENEKDAKELAIEIANLEYGKERAGKVLAFRDNKQFEKEV